MQPDFLVALALGIGLAAAAGFRIFLPLLIYGFAVREGFLTPSQGFEWAATAPALVMFGVAAIMETGAYYVPFVDNALDHIAAPLALAAGIGLVAAALGDAPPMLKWALAIIAGGGAAVATQGATTLLRGVSSTLTAGLGNHILATGEIVSAILLSLLAIVLPYVALVLVLVIVVLVARALLRRMNRSPQA